jgi:hypothetical protein
LKGKDRRHLIDYYRLGGTFRFPRGPALGNNNLNNRGVFLAVDRPAEQLEMRDYLSNMRA